MPDDLTIVAQYAKSSRDTPSEVYNAACRVLDEQAQARGIRGRRRQILRELTQQAVDAGMYGEPAPEMRPNPPEEGAESHGDGRTPQTLGTPEGQAATEAQEARE